MSLIIHPSEADQRKTFHALKVQPYLRNGVVRGHIDPVIVAAICLPQAKAIGCEDIMVGLEGMIPRRYSIRSVEEQVRKSPRKFAGWLPRQPVTQAERERNAFVQRRMQHLPGGISLV